MIAKCLERAETLGVTVRAEVQRFETLEMHRKYKSIYLAGPTFNLLPDDETALAALRRLRAHLEEDGGVAFVPLFIPDPIAEEVLHQYRETTDARRSHDPFRRDRRRPQRPGPHANRDASLRTHRRRPGRISRARLGHPLVVHQTVRGPCRDERPTDLIDVAERSEGNRLRGAADSGKAASLRAAA